MANVYYTEAGDTWDKIAYDQYGSEKFMQQLILANWDKLDVLVFSDGEEIIKTVTLGQSTGRKIRCAKEIALTCKLALIESIAVRIYKTVYRSVIGVHVHVVDEIGGAVPSRRHPLPFVPGERTCVQHEAVFIIGIDDTVTKNFGIQYVGRHARFIDIVDIIGVYSKP